MEDYRVIRAIGKGSFGKVRPLLRRPFPHSPTGKPTPQCTPCPAPPLPAGLPRAARARKEAVCHESHPYEGRAAKGKVGLAVWGGIGRRLAVALSDSHAVLAFPPLPPAPSPLHCREACKNEVLLMQRLTHPAIIGYKESFFDRCVCVDTSVRA